MIRLAAASCLFLVLAPPVGAQWRSLPTVDDLTGERMVMALADGTYGRMRMLVDCRGGFYVLALGFTAHAALANGAVVIQWGDAGPVERHYWSPDDDGEVAYVTTWPGEDAGGARYDRQALAFFYQLRRYSHLVLWATQRPAITVVDHFSLVGAAQALDALNCPHR